MRVISGTYRSRLLQEVPSDETRETKDRVKESIFNSIQFQLPQARVLDLYAGSGSLGIEALSRGAAFVHFNDSNHLARRVIEANLTTLELHSKAAITKVDSLACLTSLQEPFDIILLDPPYGSGLLQDTLQNIATHHTLAPSGIIVALYGKRDCLTDLNYGIIEYKHKSIGITNVSYLRWEDNK